MKKFVSVSIILVIFIMTQVFAFAANSFTAVKVTEAPKIDGKLDKGEWDESTKFTMNKDNSRNWTGGVNDAFEADFYFAWDEENFYMATEVRNDTTPIFGADGSAWVGNADCVQLAIEPANTKTEEQNMQWFFTIGAKEDGGVVTYRHNFGADGDITSEVTAKSSGHKEGSNAYTIEIAIPWSVMKVEGAPDFTISQDAEMPMMVCILDQSDSGLVALKSDDFDDMWAPAGLGTLKLAAGKKNPKTGVAGVAAYIAVAALGGAGMLVSKKRKAAAK